MRTFIGKIDFDRVLLSAALRKAYGAPPKHIDLYADKTPEAVWAWELGTPTVYIDPQSLLKETLAVRETLQCLAGLIQSLQKLQALVVKAKSTADLTAISNAHAKYIKLQQRMGEQKKKLLAKAHKEKQRL